jgi:hypothetical protein
MKITRSQLRQIIKEAVDDFSGGIPPEDHLPLAADAQIGKMTREGRYGNMSRAPRGAQETIRKMYRRMAAKDPKVFRIVLSLPFGLSDFEGRAYFIGNKRIIGQSEAAIENSAYDSDNDAMDARQMARFAYQLGATHILDDNFGPDAASSLYGPEIEKFYYPLPLKAWLDIVEPAMEAYKNQFATWLADAKAEKAEKDAQEEADREKSKFPFEVLPGGRDD